MKENKLSREELIETLNSCKKMFTSKLNALYPSYRHKQLQSDFDEKIEQIKSLLTPIPEDKFNELVENQANYLIKRIEYECGKLTNLQRIGIFHTFTEKGDLRDVFYVYDTLREQAGEKNCE